MTELNDRVRADLDDLVKDHLMDLHPIVEQAAARAGLDHDEVTRYMLEEWDLERAVPDTFRPRRCGEVWQIPYAACGHHKLYWDGPLCGVCVHVCGRNAGHVGDHECPECGRREERDAVEDRRLAAEAKHARLDWRMSHMRARLAGTSFDPVNPEED